MSSFSTFRRFFALAPLLWPYYPRISVIGPLGTAFAHKTGERPCLGDYNGDKQNKTRWDNGGVDIGRRAIVCRCRGIIVIGAGAQRHYFSANSEEHIRFAVLIRSSSAFQANENFFIKCCYPYWQSQAWVQRVVYVSKKLLPKISNLPGKQIRVIETHHLGPRKSIHLIAAGSRRLLIGSTSETITMLADVTDSGQSFAAELEKRS